VKVEAAMKPKNAQIISILWFWLSMAGYLSLFIGNLYFTRKSMFSIRIMLLAGIAILLTALVFQASIIRKFKSDLLIPRQPYQPRPTDAGNWLEAPVAELDKSTCGKLLASRLRRQPGLHVVVRPETPRNCTDALYDPELDG
jgi:hypothetical protein